MRLCVCVAVRACLCVVARLCIVCMLLYAVCGQVRVVRVSSVYLSVHLDRDRDDPPDRNGEEIHREAARGDGPTICVPDAEVTIANTTLEDVNVKPTPQTQRNPKPSKVPDAAL